MEVTSKSFFVSAKGGVIDYVTPDGEVLASVAVPAGRVAAAEYLAMCPLGAHITVASGLAVLDPPHRLGVQSYGPGAMESGANPDYQPTSASRFEREMRLQMAQLRERTESLAAREAAYALVERIPQAPEPASAPAPESSGVE